MRIASKAVFLLKLSAAMLLLLAAAHAAEPEYQPIMWVDLLPFEDLRALLNPPPIEHYSSEEGSYSLKGSGSLDFDVTVDDPFAKALVSSKVKPEMNDLLVRLPGFVVPLEYNDEEKVTEFFLVPYFGACIHTPPPPPNQIVFVSYPAGLELKSLYEPFNIEGKLTTASTSNQLGDSAYRIDAEAIKPYAYEEAVE